MTKLFVKQRFLKQLAGVAASAWLMAIALAPAVWAASGQLSSPANMSDATVKSIAYILILGGLLTVLFVGAFLVLNLGLMSKRDEDHTGGRNPSDVGVLKNTNWPQEHVESRSLPAEEDDEDDKKDGGEPPSRIAS